jgi:hypothetical protein
LTPAASQLHFSTWQLSASDQIHEFFVIDDVITILIDTRQNRLLKIGGKLQKKAKIGEKFQKNWREIEKNSGKLQKNLLKAKFPPNS